MHPAGAAAAEAAGGAFMDVRAAARANIILGLAMAAIALVAATFNPDDFHSQIVEHAAPAPAPAARQCAATEAEALELRGNALCLVLMGLWQAVVSLAADVAVPVSGPLRALGWLLAVWAHLTGVVNVWSLWSIVNGVAAVAVGHCGSEYLAILFIGNVLVALSYAVLLGVSLAVTFCW